MNLEQALSQGIEHHRAGRLAEAERIYRQVLAAQPNHPRALNLLGVIALDCHQHRAAVDLIRRAISLNPNVADFYCDLGAALAGMGQLDSAIDAYRTALRLQPDLVVAHNNLGFAFQQKQEWDQAIASYRAAIHHGPKYSLAYNNLGNVLLICGKFDEAESTYREALLIAPDSAQTHTNLANLLKSRGKADEAIAAYRHAVALRPDLTEPHSNLIYALMFHPNADPRSLYNEHRLWNQQHAEPLKRSIQPHNNDRDPERRLRIGYISPDFREHSVGRFLLPMFENHNRDAVEIVAYSDVIHPDSLTHQLQSFSHTWRSIVGLSDDAVAQLVRDDKIDVLVDLTMHMQRNRLLVFARKPAPVQVTYLAYCGTTGLDTIDYRISDPYLDPPETDESVYSERTLRLPHCYWCYKPDDIAPSVNPLPAQSNEFITYGCLNNFGKVTPATLTTWFKLLKATPGSRLILHTHEGSHRHELKQLMSDQGIDSERLIFASFASMPEYLQLYHQIDIAIDPFPYNGGTTSCDALWMGVPLISLIGNRPVGRAGVTLLSNIGLSELLASSEDEYVKIASHLAQDLPRLSNLRATLRSRMQASPLLDAPRFTRDMEQAFRQMWRRWCSEDTLAHE